MSRPKEKNKETVEQKKDDSKQELSNTWSQDAQDELQEFIEMQGIYLRQ